MTGKIYATFDAIPSRHELERMWRLQDVALRKSADTPELLTDEEIHVITIMGSEDEARITVRTILANHPNLTASRWAKGLPYRHQKDLDALITPLRLAGLPE